MPDANALVQQAVDDAIGRGLEAGLQVAAYLDGELVVDAWGGLADESTGRQVDVDTLFNVFSATKGVASTALHVQAERGLVDYDAPIVRYWPEFAAHDKERATVRDALLHRTGVPQMPADITPELMCDWEHMARAMADAEPRWEPGTRSGYHGYTYGWIVGEIVRRTDPKGRPFNRFVQEELCDPFGIDSLFLGIPDEAEHRIARLTDPPPLPPEFAAMMPPLFAEAFPEPVALSASTFERPDVRRSCHPGAGGIMSARSLAKHYALLAQGGTLDGVRLLSPERVDLVRQLYSDDVDAVIGQPYRRGLGYWLGGEPLSGTTGPIGKNPRAFGHPGFGGSIGWADPDARLAAAILKNRLSGAATAEDNPLTAIGDAIRRGLGVNG
jgi:CubicO group peptidase (beta-lactamase class C family)